MNEWICEEKAVLFCIWSFNYCGFVFCLKVCKRWLNGCWFHFKAILQEMLPQSNRTYITTPNVDGFAFSRDNSIQFHFQFEFKLSFSRFYNKYVNLCISINKSVPSRPGWSPSPTWMSSPLHKPSHLQSHINWATILRNEKSNYFTPVVFIIPIPWHQPNLIICWKALKRRRKISTNIFWRFWIWNHRHEIG